MLKGHRDHRDGGGKAFINLTGNAGMATAGSGDVLTGMIAAWSRSSWTPKPRTSGIAFRPRRRDLAEADEGETALIAGDILDRLGDAVLDLTARRKKA